MRAAAKFQDMNDPLSTASRHLISPPILHRLLGKMDSPSNNQDLTTRQRQLIDGQVPLNIMTVTWNHARTEQTQNIFVDKLFPDYRNYNVIAYGGQECGSEQIEEVRHIESYL